MTEDATSRFNSWKNEKRVLITWQELNDVIFNARRRQEMYARDLPETFWDNDCVKDQAVRGTISPVEEDDDGGPTFYPEDRSLIHTEIGMSQSLQECDGDATVSRGDSDMADSLIALSDTVQRSSDTFLSTQSIQRRLSEMVRMMSRSEADEILLSEFTQMQERVTWKLLNLLGKKCDFSGSIVS